MTRGGFCRGGSQNGGRRHRRGVPRGDDGGGGAGAGRVGHGRVGLQGQGDVGFFVNVALVIVLFFVSKIIVVGNGDVGNGVANDAFDQVLGVGFHW